MVVMNRHDLWALYFVGFLLIAVWLQLYMRINRDDGKTAKWIDRHSAYIGKLEEDVRELMVAINHVQVAVDNLRSRGSKPLTQTKRKG